MWIKHLLADVRGGTGAMMLSVFSLYHLLCHKLNTEMFCISLISFPFFYLSYRRFILYLYQGSKPEEECKLRMYQLF